jgi:PIN domain nuclease of toxin-antitoxin system
MPSTPLVIPGAAMLRCIFQKGGVDWAINVYGANNVSAVAVNQALANTLGTAIKGFFTSSGWKTHIATNISLKQIGIRDINVANQAEYFDAGASVAGTGVGDALPYQTSLTLTLRTALAGKSYRGRTYLFGVLEGDNDSAGQIAATASVAAIAYVNGIGSALSSNGLQLAVLSRKNLIATPVATVVQRDLNWTVQRRRRLGI